MSEFLTSTLYDSPDVRASIDQVDSCRLLSELGVILDSTVEKKSFTPRLRVAASMAFAEFLNELGKDIDALLRRLLNPEAEELDIPKAKAVFKNWLGYIESIQEDRESPTIDDLLFFSSSGLMAKRNTDVRSILGRDDIRLVVNREIGQTNIDHWIEYITTNISLALLLLIRQSNHFDVELAGKVIQKLADFQKQVELSWLEKQAYPEKQSVVLLGLYHIAQAVIRSSEFLLVGSVIVDGKPTSDFLPELRRLISHSYEYLSLHGDIETIFWLSAVSIILIKLRGDSIWISGLNISQKVDDLIKEMTSIGRDRPIFSLLPSQQEALRKNLLDPTNFAIILQMPTSAGKTLLAEFSIVQSFEAYKGARVAYIVPTRALATQVRRTLLEDLRPLGIQVSAAGSAFEEDPFEIHMLESTDGVVVATPEKLDLLLRAHPDWFENLRLIVVDEAHLLNEKNSDRGVRLELLLANIRREQPHARLLLLTPFVSNAREIGAWLAGNRGHSISVHWKPSRILLGICQIGGRGLKRSISINWRDPNDEVNSPSPINIPTNVKSIDVQSNSDKIAFLAEKFLKLGTVLALCSASRVDAEEIAYKVAQQREPIPKPKQTPAMRVASAIARNEFGENSSLAYCIERGVAFHHSALSSMLRYLVEDQLKLGHLNFVAATTTLAQGMNFPVATVLIHSLSKPYGGGNLSSGEFWNIAGRAGRVGMSDRGLVIFTNPSHQTLVEEYCKSTTNDIRSALLDILGNIAVETPLKELYSTHKELRPFIQYLAHAAASKSVADALAKLEDLLQASLANVQISDSKQSQNLRKLSRAYLAEISKQNTGYLKVVDSTGLGSFSFNELYGKINDSPVLSSGPKTVLQQQQNGMSHLVEALRWLPELSLAIGREGGPMSVKDVATIIQGWIEGKSVHEFSKFFPGKKENERVRKAATYVFSNVSQTVSWGAHAYIQGWGLRGSKSTLNDDDAMLPAYIQYGVKTPEAAVASTLGMPRQFAESIATEYRNRYGKLVPEKSAEFKSFVESADLDTWRSIVSKSPLNNLNPSDVRTVWRGMQGLPID